MRPTYIESGRESYRDRSIRGHKEMLVSCFEAERQVAERTEVTRTTEIREELPTVQLAKTLGNPRTVQFGERLTMILRITCSVVDGCAREVVRIPDIYSPSPPLTENDCSRHHVVEPSALITPRLPYSCSVPSS